MSMVTYPLNNVEYTAEDAELFHVTRTSGVYANNSFDYSLSGADNTVVIGKGIAWIKNSEFAGKVVAQKEAVSLNMGLPDANYPRIDAIIIKFDANSNSTDIVVKEGTASSNPIAPVVTRTESIYELHLYHVRRNAGSLYIVANDITDLRTDNNYCGLMADSVTAIDAVPFERKINGYTLEQDINLTASDVGAYPIYKSLADIGCTTASTLQEVYTALPQGSVLILDWCGNSVTGYSGTTFGNAMPANYGPLYLYKPGGTNGVGKFEFWAWNSSETSVPYVKFVTNANSTWSETEWMADASKLALIGSVTSSSSVSITSAELAKHKGIVLQAECAISGTSAGDVKYIPKQLISSNAVIYTVGISAYNTTTAFGTMSVGVSNTAVAYKAKVESGVSCSAVKVYYYD